MLKINVSYDSILSMEFHTFKGFLTTLTDLLEPKGDKK